LKKIHTKTTVTSEKSLHTANVDWSSKPFALLSE